MKVWFDTEFIEDGRTIDLISLGMVREDGSEFYAESSDCDLERACPWVRENVLPHLLGHKASMSRAAMAREVQSFVGPHPEFWAYYADYDWVALCQLYGRMIDLPESWPKMCMDVKQLSLSLDSPLVDVSADRGIAHRAIDDARWVKALWQGLQPKRRVISTQTLKTFGG
jgi:hypothetical protein